jgi:branched-chain amino acid transport system substrate-binding protein
VRKQLRGGLALVAALSLTLAGCGRSSGGSGDPGISDDSVKLGAFTPLSGAGAVTSSATKGSAAYFKYLNAEKGGVKFADGRTRKIDFTVYDSRPASSSSRTRSSRSTARTGPRPTWPSATT